MRGWRRTVCASNRRTFIVDGVDTIFVMYVSTALNTSILPFAVRLNGWSKACLLVTTDYSFVLFVSNKTLRLHKGITAEFGLRSSPKSEQLDLPFSSNFEQIFNNVGILVMHLPMIAHDGCEQISPVLESARWLQKVWKSAKYFLRPRS